MAFESMVTWSTTNLGVFGLSPYITLFVPLAPLYQPTHFHIGYIVPIHFHIRQQKEENATELPIDKHTFLHSNAFLQAWQTNFGLRCKGTV